MNRTPVCPNCMARQAPGHSHCQNCGRATGHFARYFPHYWHGGVRFSRGRTGPRARLIYEVVVLAWLVGMTVRVILVPSQWPLLVLPAGFGLIIYLGLRSHNKGKAKGRANEGD